MDKEQTPQEKKVTEVAAVKPAPVKKKQYSKGLDRTIFLTLVVISVAVIAAVLFSNAGLGEYSGRQTVTLEGVDVPTISAVVGERRVRAIEANIIPGTISSEVFLFEAIGDSCDISDADLLSYARYLIENESFLPLQFDGTSMNFALAKAIGGNRVFKIESHHESNEIMIEYIITVDADTYNQINRFKRVKALFEEFELDIEILLNAANGLNEAFWDFVTEAAVNHHSMSETAAEGSGNLLNRYLEITWTD